MRRGFWLRDRLASVWRDYPQSSLAPSGASRSLLYPKGRCVSICVVTQPIQFETVSPANLAELLALQVRDDQRAFVPSIGSSIELAEGYPSAVCLAVRVENEICGFALYGIEEESGSWKIFRLIIDKAVQGRGIGRRAMNLLLERIRVQHGAHEVRIAYDASNVVAQALYSSLGFVEYGTRGHRKLAVLAFAARAGITPRGC